MEEQSKLCLETCVCVCVAWHTCLLCCMCSLLLGTQFWTEAFSLRYSARKLHVRDRAKPEPLSSTNIWGKGKITTRTCSAASVSVTNAVGKVGKVQVADIDCVDASCCIILMKNNSITPKLRSLEFVWPMGLIQLVQANQTAYLSLSLLSSLS